MISFPSPFITVIVLDTSVRCFTNASTRTLIEGGNFGERIQHTFRPSLPLELPHRIPLPPVPPMIYDASGMDNITDENRGNTTPIPI